MDKVKIVRVEMDLIVNSDKFSPINFLDAVRDLPGIYNSFNLHVEPKEKDKKL